ncbi:cytochrome P450 [Nocardia brevicatena]|uniref:cytochrome P450 n=1 Tax=Nocardia brevicatena TaxID=37327 RepID=UPI0002F823C0|nr:cytochrome P450 [Nocardia brevicatena]
MLRDIIEPYFHKGAVERLGSAIWGHAQGLVHAIIDKGTGEVNIATELAYPLALATNCSLVGIPAEHREWLSDQLYTVIRTPRGGLGEREPEEVEAYLWELIRHRAAHPGDGLLDDLVTAWRADVITDIELLGTVWSLSQSAVEDAGTNTANAFALLGEFDLLGETRKKMHDDTWLHWAGEEVLRFGTPFPARPAVTVTDIVLDGGVRIPARTPVRLWLSAANRDPAVNGGNRQASDPDVFDVTRSPNRHLGFGVGPRMCIAALLARLQTRIALRTVLSHLPDLRPDLERPFERHAGITDGVLQAHFRFDQRGAEG